MATKLAVVENGQTELERVNAELKDAQRARREADKLIRRLERRRAALRGGKRRPRRRSADLDPHKQAGPKNVDLMERTFRRLGEASVAEATREAGSEPGHQTWAIRALESDGVIERTGERKGVSVVYRYKRRRKVTRIRPGK
jgi:hypothetical protein